MKRNSASKQSRPVPTQSFFHSRPAIAATGLIAIGAVCFAFASGFPGERERVTGGVATSATTVANIADRPDGGSEESLANRKLQMALIQAELTPENLAAAGVSSNSVTALVASARAWMLNNSTALETSTNSARTAKLAIATLDKLRERGLATNEQLSQLAANQQVFATAKAAFDTIIDDLKSAATSGLTEQERANLRTLSSRTGFPGPIALRLGNRTETDSLALRNVAANQRIAARLGADFVGEENATTYSDSDATIMSQYQENLPLIQHAWLDAVGSL